MANSEGKQDTGQTPRVYRAKEVHKRRPADVRSKEEPLQEGSSSLEQVVQSETPSSDGAAAAEATPDGVASDDVASAQDEAVESIPEGTQSDSPTAGESTRDDGLLESDDATEKARKKGKRLKNVVIAVLALIVAAALVLLGFTVGSRWLRFNDEADMQGKWFVYGTSVPVSFTKDAILINDETSYSYHIDPTAKTIEYTFGNLAGQGRYWFNDGRDVLIITDGSGYTMWSTLLDDFAYGLKSQFGNKELPATDSSIVFTRSVVQKEEPATSESASHGDASNSAETTGDSSGSKSSDSLMVSDIMMHDEKTDSDGQAEGAPSGY